jgi:hypothetical protein
MGKFLALLVPVCAAIVLSGCASTQLNYNTLDIASNVGEIIKHQTMTNLGKFIANPDTAMPSHVAFNTGTVQTTNTVTPSLTAPIGHALTLTNTVASGATTTVTNGSSSTAPNSSFGLSATNSWQQSWIIDPVTSSLYVRPLRYLYRYVVGAIGEQEFLRDFAAVKPELVGQSCYRYLICRMGKQGIINPRIRAMRENLFWLPSKDPARLPPPGAKSLGTFGGYEIFTTNEEAVMEFILYVEDIVAVDPGGGSVIGVTSQGHPVIAKGGHR